MDDKPDREDIPVPGTQRHGQSRPEEEVRTRNDEDSGPDASEAPEEEGSASRP